MRVKVYLSAFGDGSVLEEGNWLELKEGATLKDAVKKLGIPVGIRHLPMISVNNRRSKLSKVLEDGDRIAFFSLHAGG